MTLCGILVLHDPPKEDAARTVSALQGLGVTLKIITGDSALAAAHLAEQVLLGDTCVLTGQDVRAISDEALPQRAAQTTVFAEIEPDQKERIIRALRRAGHVVGYMGDGINDAPALHAADVGISVNGAADVAREAADIVVLKQDLSVLERGIREGRKTFANTLKYVFMATSANFGNMFSMAGASLFLPFLPLLPKQILLINLLTDFPEISIATDRVDDDWQSRPRHWDFHFIRNFMLTFGVVSSIFDYVTFGALLWVLHASPVEFRTGWFLESVVSATLIVLVIRTRHSVMSSRPSGALVAATLAAIAVTIALPFSNLGAALGFGPIGFRVVAFMLGVTGLYVTTAELVKRWFYGGNNDESRLKRQPHAERRAFA